MKGAIEKAKELEQEIENAVILGQFVNTANPRAHEKTTGPEIWEDTQGQVDLFVAGVGTGGTITGTGAYLKSVNPSIEIVAVEPASSAVLSGENPGPHGLQGIGAGFVPDVLNTSVYDRISKVKEQEAYKASRLLAERRSSGWYFFWSSTVSCTFGGRKRGKPRKDNCSIASGYRRTISFHTAF